jgi:hypothetical protein
MSVTSPIFGVTFSLSPHHLLGLACTPEVRLLTRGEPLTIGGQEQGNFGNYRLIKVCWKCGCFYEKGTN